GAAFAGRNVTLPFPGAALLVKRASILQAKGFTGSPMELFVRLHGVGLASGKPYRVVFLPEAVSHKAPPHTFPELKRQLNEEQRDIAHACKMRAIIAGPFGWQILKGLYYSRLLRPLLETIALVLAFVGVVTGWVDVFTFLLVLVAAVGMGIILSM